MAHIQLTSSELKIFQNLNLPEGTTLVSTTDEGKLSRSFIIENNQFKLVKDFEELKRDFKNKEEEKDFFSSFDKIKLIDYFILYDDNVSDREFNAAHNLENSFHKNIKHSGTYKNIEGKCYNIFSIHVNKNDDLKLVEEEVSLLLSRSKYHWPNLKELEFSVFEHTCSEYASYSLLFKTENGSWELKKCVGLRENIEKVFNNLFDCLKYLQKNHWYWA